MNIIDNAIYWLKQSDVPEKVIRLHADDTGIYISNNGIEIKPQDKERIFELRFSRKPNGRGLGLSISKEVLNAENYDIFVAQPKEGSTVTFKNSKNAIKIWQTDLLSNRKNCKQLYTKYCFY